MMLTDEYIAGFFDGEGHVAISASLQVQVCITQKKKEVLQLIMNKYGGHLYQAKRNPVWTLKICGKEKISIFLKAISPHLVVKKREAEIALLATERIRTDNNGCIPLDENERAIREGLRKSLQEIRPSKNFYHLQSEEYRYRQSIKDKFDYKCFGCGKDMKETRIRDQIIKDDKLWCFPCRGKFNSQRRYNKEIHYDG